jgi:hypothetical protein
VASQLTVCEVGNKNFAVVTVQSPNEQSFVAVTVSPALAAKKVHVISSGTLRSATLKFRQVTCLFFMASSCEAGMHLNPAATAKAVIDAGRQPLH